MNEETYKAGRFPCAHCGGAGVCRSGRDGASCHTCLKEADADDNCIVKCEVCIGFGMAEPKSERLMARLPVIIVLMVLGVFYFYAFMYIDNDQKFDQIFPIVASLTTMIVTFYFSRK